MTQVSRCPNLETNQQIEFDLKIKLLFDTLDLLGLHPSDRQTSSLVEKDEEKRRLYARLGKSKHSLNERNEATKLIDLVGDNDLTSGSSSFCSNDRKKNFVLSNERKNVNRSNEIIRVVSYGYSQ